MLKQFLRWLLTLIYKVEIKGLDNYKNAGKRVLIISNHTSFLDPLLLGVFLPDDITFAINTQISERWWLKPFLGLSRVFPMDPTHPLSLKDLIHHLQQDTHTVIFPEGRITVTGSLMKIYDGTGMVADKSEAAILPVRIEGAEYTHFSKLRNIVRLRLFPKITIQILPHTFVSPPKELSGKSRRKYSGHILADIMTEMMFATSHYRQTIFASLLEARKIHGCKHTVANDLDRVPLTYDNLITRAIIIGNALKSITVEAENVGVFLPNSIKTLAVVLGLQLYGRVPAMLNFSTGSAGMVSACNIAQVKTVLTSRRFIEMGQLTEEAGHLAEQVNLVYLEDLAARLSLSDKLQALVQCKTANIWYKHTQYSPDSP
ncbi:MAG: 1-acyl-sn-glycerol-3-phosphate acyltransferase, partial [Methylobacter sp.]